MPYIGGFPAYVEKCSEVVAAGYRGFALSGTMAGSASIQGDPVT